MSDTNKLDFTKPIKELPYSYHTFLFAFYYGTGSSRIAPRNSSWTPESFRNGADDEALKLNYANYQYFTPEARQLLFNEKGIKTYVYSIPDRIKREYLITKNRIVNDSVERITYNLYIHNIRAILFNNNIGILCFELENHLHRSLSAVRQINEYGRRINLPFAYAPGMVSHPLVAEKISILGRETDLRSFGKKAFIAFSDGRDNSDCENADRFINIIPPVYDLISDLIPGCREYVPVMDDRMFVCCLIRDEAFSHRIKPFCPECELQGTTATKENFVDVKEMIYKDLTLSKEIYSLAFVDASAEAASCQSADMREMLLRRCVYDRWRDWGTMDVITHHSLIRITGESDEIISSVINPFVSQYVTMAIGALIQRATILLLSKQCADISEKRFATEDNCADSKIKKLKRDYVYAQNNIFLNQLTVQEQGVEEFEMLKNELYISESLKKLDSSINGIYEFTREYAEIEENDLLSKITKIGLPLAFIQTFSVITSFALVSQIDGLGYIGTGLIQIGIFASVTILAWLLYKKIVVKSMRRKSVDQNNKKSEDIE